MRPDPAAGSGGGNLRWLNRVKIMTALFGLRAAALAAFLLAATVWSAPAVGQVLCGPGDGLVELLKQRFGETRQAVGVSADARRIVELFVAPDGSWTIVVTDTQGRSCIVLSGEDWTRAPQMQGMPLGAQGAAHRHILGLMLPLFLPYRRSRAPVALLGRLEGDQSTNFSLQRRSNRRRDIVRRPLDRLRREVGVARRGLDLGVAEHLADHGQALAARHRDRREGVAQIVDADIVERGAARRVLRCCRKRRPTTASFGALAAACIPVGSVRSRTSP